MSKLSLFLSLSLCLFFVGVTNAQETLSLGPRIGFNSSKLVGDDVESNANAGLVLGLTSTYSINEKTGIGIDLLYSQEGAESAISDEINTELDYIRIPLTFQYFFRGWEDDFRPKVYAGLAPGFLVSAEIEEMDIKDNTNSFDLSAVLGLGFNYQLTPGGIWLNTDFRYLPGLTNIIDGENVGEANNQSLQFSLGIVFGLNPE